MINVATQEEMKLKWAMDASIMLLFDDDWLDTM